eukprot:Rmarinus@m.23538
MGKKKASGATERAPETSEDTNAPKIQDSKTENAFAQQVDDKTTSFSPPDPRVGKGRFAQFVYRVTGLPLIPDTSQSLAGFWKVWNEKSNWPVIRRLIAFTVLMILLPVSTYFLFYSYALDEIMRFFHRPEMEVNLKMTVSGLAAVLMTNIVVLVYIILAFREKTPGKTD